MRNHDPSQSLFLSPRLSKKEWEQAVEALPRFGETMVEATRRVLVEGETPSDVSREIDVSRQAISAAVQRVIDKYLHLVGKVVSDEPHMIISFAVPHESRAEIRELCQQYLSEVRDAATSGRKKRRVKVRWRRRRPAS